MSSPDANEIGRIWDFEKPMPQQFSLPAFIVYYMSKNPTTPEVYEKLIRTCKYFYSKNPIIVAEFIKISKDYFRIRVTYVSKTYPIISNLNQISCKFWITGEVSVDGSLSFAIDILREKMFKLTKLSFWDMHVPIDTVSSIKVVKLMKELKLVGSVPEFADGTLMPCEKVFESFPNLEGFKFYM